MGVLQCDRKGCPEIMCDYYVLNVGYICGECKSEFQAMINGKSRILKHAYNEEELRNELRIFSEMPKDESKETLDDMRLLIDKLFEGH